MSCSLLSSKKHLKDTDLKNSKTSSQEISNYTILETSEVWRFKLNTELDTDLAFKKYQRDKENEKSKLYYSNLMTMWHVTLQKHVSNLNNDQLLELFNDMNLKDENIASIDTYYAIVLKLKDRKRPNITTLENIYYNKNMQFLNNKAWKNENLRKKKIDKLRKIHFVIN